MLSIIICTYNSEKRLSLVLDSINNSLKHITNINEIELIIIDNNSNDDTNNVATNFNIICKKFVYKEETQGLMYARKKGVKMSSNNWILFLDDDNIISPNFLKELLCFLDTSNTKIVVNPRIFPVNYKDENWNDHEKILLEIALNHLACNSMDLNQKIDKINFNKFVGAGLLVNKNLIDIFFKKDFTFTGRIGTNLSSGDDTEIINFMRKMGCRFIILSEIYIKHLIPKSRLNYEYLSDLYKSINNDKLNFRSLTRFSYYLLKPCFNKKALIKRKLILNSFFK